MEKQFDMLHTLCIQVREGVESKAFDHCMELISQAMGQYPDAPHPHNLMGIVLEKQGRHADAMRHFRAAYALDPGYKPAQSNLETYGTFRSRGRCAYEESDCIQAAEPSYTIHYDARGIGRMIRRS